VLKMEVLHANKMFNNVSVCRVNGEERSLDISPVCTQYMLTGNSGAKIGKLYTRNLFW